jgi:protein ImuB
VTHEPLQLRTGQQDRRYLALWFPYLSTDRWMRANRSSAAPAEPFALTDKQQGALRLVAVNAQAKKLGLHPGLALTDARSRMPDLHVEQSDVRADAALLMQLAGLCEFFTPLFALDGDDGLLMDITGCAHLFGGENGLLEHVTKKFIRTQITFRYSIAVTPHAARAIARHLAEGIVPHDATEAVVRRLPLAALDISADSMLALKRAGLRHLGDLLDRPSQTLSARFGMALVTQMGRIAGREDMRLTPLRTPPDCMAEQQFVSPLCDLENLLVALERLVVVVSRELEERGSGGRLFETLFFRSDGAIRRIHIETAEPVRDVGVVLRLMRLRIEGLSDPLDPGFGFDAMRFGVLNLAPFQQPQVSFDGNQQQAEEINALIDSYGVNLGAVRVARFVVRDTHNPVLAAASIPVLSHEHSDVVGFAEDPPLRPLTLFDRPQPIEALAEVPDGPPLRFRWRHVLHDVARAEGPERITPEWWRQDSAMHTRDYYRVEDTHGYRFWVYREGLYGQGLITPRWYVHGLFP